VKKFQLILSGELILKNFHGHDATEAFYSLHSKDAVAMLKQRRPMETKEAPIEPHEADKGALTLPKLTDQLFAD
jgi:hypothetical protein